MRDAWADGQPSFARRPEVGIEAASPPPEIASRPSRRPLYALDAEPRPPARWRASGTWLVVLGFVLAGAGVGIGGAPLRDAPVEPAGESVGQVGEGLGISAEALRALASRTEELPAGAASPDASGSAILAREIASGVEPVGGVAGPTADGSPTPAPTVEESSSRPVLVEPSRSLSVPGALIGGVSPRLATSTPTGSGGVVAAPTPTAAPVTPTPTPGPTWSAGATPPLPSIAASTPTRGTATATPKASAVPTRTASAGVVAPASVAPPAAAVTASPAALEAPGPGKPNGNGSEGRDGKSGKNNGDAGADHSADRDDDAPDRRGRDQRDGDKKGDEGRSSRAERTLGTLLEAPRSGD